MLTWQDYEAAVLEHIRQEYAGLAVRVCGTEDGKRHTVLGRFSRVERQLDIAAYTLGEERPFFIADAKKYAGKVDVKDVEGFFGMVDDVGARFSALLAPEGFTEAARRRAEAMSMHLAIVTIDEALTHRWLRTARSLYPYDWAFRREMSRALRGLAEGAHEGDIVRALEELAFEEWLAVVDFAIAEYRTTSIRVLAAVAKHHSDLAWRYNAVSKLIDASALDMTLHAYLLESESDAEFLELLELWPISTAQS